MKRSFMLFAVFMSCFSLFAENHEAHSCLEYAKVMFPNYDENPDDDILEIVWDDPVLSEVTQFDDDFIPDWFEHFEFADGNYGYDEEFLQEHGGRVGKIISMNPDSTYGLGCSGTLIGENYFLTAGHCANIANVGVLFGYQIADLYEDNDGTNHPTYPRVSLTGYLNDNGNYILYEDPRSEYFDVTEHPAYFPIDKNFQYRYNDDYSVENGLAKVGWISEEDNIAQYAETILWPNDDPDGEEIGKIDYAIYKLESKIDFSQSNEPIPPSKWLDPWSWVSENNQDDGIPDKPWRLLDNTNGKRGWARVNTGVLQENSTLSIMGFPNVASELVGNINYQGLKVVNNGSVDNDQYRGYAFSGDYEEDLLIFKNADIQMWHSGSSVIDYSGKLAGLVAWFGCAPGGWDEWSRIMQNIKNEYITLHRPATNYATPMWKICRASQIIKNAAKDTDCNGRIDWQDFIFATRLGLSQYINIGIDFNLIKNFEIPTTVEEIHIHRFDMGQKKVVTETREIPANTYQVAWSDNGDFFYVVNLNNSYYLFKNGASIGTISNYPQLSGSSTLVKGNDIYLAGGSSSNINIMLPTSGNNGFVPRITKISSDGQNGYTFSTVADLPSDFEDIRIFSLGNDIYVSGNTNNSFVIYEIVPNSEGELPYTLSLVSDTSQPVRKDYNLTASDGKIIVSGGATDYISTVLNLDEEDYPSTFSVYGNIIMLEPAVSNNWVTVADNINDKIIMFSVTAIDNGNLVVVNPFITVGNSMQKFVLNLSDIPINNETIRVSFEFHPVGFCLSESGVTVSGGIETSGECVPFTHPWYNSFSAGATVYSLDGKGERLYVGMNNAIKVYDISDPITPVLLSSFSTSSRVNDLEVYGDALFTATNGGLYKLDASNDTLTQTLFVSAFLNNQYKVEVYNGKLYVGDDNGIKVRDLETLSVLTSVNNGTVLDFAIENGEIGLYKDALFSPVEIRDAETLTLKANEFFGCFEIEVGSSDGRFYLSCDDETYRFEDDGDEGISFTELSGDIRELQDVYTFDGYTYFYDENTIWISTNNDVPALCGNGIVEGDEVCDGAPRDCEDLDSNYVSGTATCNSTCDGYNTNNCSDDGW